MMPYVPQEESMSSMNRAGRRCASPTRYGWRSMAKVVWDANETLELAVGMLALTNCAARCGADDGA